MLRRRIRIMALSFGLLSLQLTTACSNAEAPPRSLSDNRLNDPAPALWKVADDDTTIYLFGTIHLLPEDVEWYKPHIASALENADEYVTELDPAETQAAASVIADKGALVQGENLREMLNAEDRQAYEELLVTLGLPVDSFDNSKPWFAAWNLLYAIPLVMAGYKDTNGVESVLATHPRADAARTGLESASFQVGIYDNMSQEAQVAYLMQVVRDAPQLTQDLDEIVSFWLKGDTASIAARTNPAVEEEVLYSKLITERNAKWAHWIEDRLDQPGTVFIAVGAGHLAGKGSVQEQLRSEGIRANRVR